jgi:serine/threonine protein kinase
MVNQHKMEVFFIVDFWLTISLIVATNQPSRDKLMTENHRDDDQTQSFVSLTKGTEVGHYKIISKIGAGGMGEVYLAEDTKLKRQVALKFLPHHYAGDKDLRERFTREAQATAKLDHPNIVPVYEVGEYQGRPYFAMAHIEGQSLRDVIKDGKLGIDDAVNLTMQICEGLQEAHDAGIVHRDIKPGNIIIDNKGRPRLVDFGLAMVSGEDKLTKTGSTLGTVGYMSPEQVEGKKCDHRSDLFSIGVILYEMLTGRRPFEGDNDAAIVRAITDSTPEPVARFKSGTTGELQQVIDKALAKDVSIRYQTAGGMLADLKRLQIGIPRPQKGKLVYWIAAAIIVIIGGYFGVTALYTDKSKPVKKKRVVVLPFVNMGASDKDYFASGITEEITARLTNISGLAVVSNPTANRYRHSEKTMRQIGEELSAEFIVNGSIQWQESPDGEKRLKLTAHLIKADEDVSVWSKTYDTVMTEVFSVQSDIAENVSEQMGIKLNVIDRKQVWERHTNSQEAYDFYLQGRRYIAQLGGFGSIRDFRLAADMYQKAIALDSAFVNAYFRLSYAYSRIWGRGDRSDSIKAGAIEAAQHCAGLRTNPGMSMHLLKQIIIISLSKIQKRH